MGITSAIVLYAVVWFLTLLMIAPLRIKTQGDLGKVTHGTHAGSPEVHHLRKKIWITTGVAFVIWAVLVGIILSGWFSVNDFNLLD